MNQDGNEFIKQIQEEIKQQQKIGGLWEGYCNLQKLASGDIWESSTRYIYELLQNAEDAEASEFTHSLGRYRLSGKEMKETKNEVAW